jgi:hypothetical protein
MANTISLLLTAIYLRQSGRTKRNRTELANGYDSQLIP